MKIQVLVILLILYFQTMTSLHHSLPSDWCPKLAALPSQNIIKTKKSKLYLLQGPEGKQYLLKQSTNMSPSHQLKIIFEAIGSKIAESIDIPCDHVDIIPAYDSCYHKSIPDMPAALMDVVPGECIRYGTQYKKINLRQIIKGGNIEKSGVPLKVIKNMALHKDLPRIMALDTYIGNTDRSAGNVYYDSKTDRFYAIDFGQSFQANLCKGFYITVNKIKNKELAINRNELSSLALYNDTLKKLIVKNPPHKINNDFRALIAASGLMRNPKMRKKFTISLKNLLKLRENLMKRNYREAHKLVSSIDSLLKAYH